MFEAALDAELAEVVAEFKAKAAAVWDVDEVWEIGNSLHRRRREIEEKYDFRYSQLLFVFGRLLREGRIQRDQLEGLSAEKLEFIDRMMSL